MSEHGAPPWVLLPGMMCDERLFEAQVELLSAHARDVQVGDITQFDSVHAIAADVLTHAPPRFCLAGLSMGGIIAFEIWRQASQRVVALVLMDTNARAEDDKRRAVRADQIRRVGSGGLRNIMQDEMKPRYLAEKSLVHRDLLDGVMQMALDLGPDVFIRQSRALGNRPDSLATLAKIDCPSLVLCGAEDTLCPVEYHEAMAERLPNAELVVVPDCGHLATLEAPEAVNQALISCLQRLRNQN